MNRLALGILGLLVLVGAILYGSRTILRQIRSTSSQVVSATPLPSFEPIVTPAVSPFIFASPTPSTTLPKSGVLPATGF